MELEFVKEALGKQHHLLVGEGYCCFRIALGAGEDSTSILGRFRSQSSS